MKKLNKTAIVLMTAATVMASFTACSPKNDAKSDAKQDEKVYKIGVIQFMEHSALDESYKGFVAGLAEAGYVEGENIEIQFSNAQGEIANCQTISEKLVNDKSDLILAIATPAAQAVANATETIPVLITAVTDPAASSLVKSNEKPGGNITGTSDLTPVKEQLELLKQLVPNAKKIGLLYCSGEANSKIQIDIAKQVVIDLGMEPIEYTVSSQNEIQQVVTSMIGKVDAAYSPTDNMVAIGIPTIGDILSSNKIGIVVGEGGMVRAGGFASYAMSYYDLGKKTAEQAAKILKGEAKPADMPIEYINGTELIINKTYADKIGVTIPQEIADKAILVEQK